MDKRIANSAVAGATALVSNGRVNSNHLGDSMPIHSATPIHTGLGRVADTARHDNVVQSKVDEWLRSFGLTHDPFRVLNAGEDTRLREYLVAHDAFEAIRADETTLLFAPAGGGKSAFRVRLADACRAGENGRRLFPIAYLIPDSILVAPTQDEWPAHERAICQAAALELWLRFSFRPQEFLDLDQHQRWTVRFMLDRALPGPLDYFLDALVSGGDPAEAARVYDPTARWPNVPTAEQYSEFYRALKAVVGPGNYNVNPHSLNAWARLLVEDLNFEGVFLLLDGIDAYPETLKNAQTAVQLLNPLLSRAAQWTQLSVFFKAFLPVELLPLMRQEELTTDVRIVTIVWSQELLVSFIRRRVEAAMKTAPASLDMLSDPGLRNLDASLVSAAKPLPRDVMMLVERLFFEHVRRAGASGKLSEEDLEAALAGYQNEQ